MVQRHFLSNQISKVQNIYLHIHMELHYSYIILVPLPKNNTTQKPFFSSFNDFLFLVFKFSYWLQRFHISWSSNPFSWCFHTSLLCLWAHSINAFMPPNCHLPKITSFAKKSRKVELDIKCFKKVLRSIGMWFQRLESQALFFISKKWTKPSLNFGTKIKTKTFWKPNSKPCSQLHFMCEHKTKTKIH